MSRQLAPGEIVLEDAWRSFSPRSDRGRTLKELLTSIGRRTRATQEMPATEALAGVSLRVAPGETLGIVGRNGAGKTSTLRVLAGIIPLHRGFAGCGGRVATLIELGAGFGREFTGRENIRVSAALHGMSRDEVDARIEEIIEFSELGHFIDAPTKTYSSGMLVRLGFSVAAHLEADVLLIDEVLAVGDESFQRKCLRQIHSRIEHGTTVVLVSHAPGTIERACRRVVVLDHGRVVFNGPTAQGLDHYHRMLGMEDEAQASARRARNATVAVREASLEDGDGRRRQVFETGERLRLVIGLETRVPGAEEASAQKDAAQIVIDFRTASGQPVFRDRRPVARDGRASRLVLDVPSLALLGGDYDVAIGVHEPGDTAPGIDRLLSFSVAGEEQADGVVDLRAAWTFTSGRVEASR